MRNRNSESVSNTTKVTDGELELGLIYSKSALHSSFVDRSIEPLLPGMGNAYSRGALENILGGAQLVTSD